MIEGERGERGRGRKRRKFVAIMRLQQAVNRKLIVLLDVSNKIEITKQK